MPLSDHEQRMLDQIESELSTEDPKLRLERPGWQSACSLGPSPAPGRSSLRDRRGDAGIGCGLQGHHDRKLPDPQRLWICGHVRRGGARNYRPAHRRWARQVGLRVGRVAPASGETLRRLIYRAHGRSLPPPLRSVGSGSEFSADAGPEVRPFTVSYRSENWGSVAGRSVCRHLAAPKCVSRANGRHEQAKQSEGAEDAPTSLGGTSLHCGHDGGHRWSATRRFRAIHSSTSRIWIALTSFGAPAPERT